MFSGGILVPIWLVLLGAFGILSAAYLGLFALQNRFKMQKFHFEMKFLLQSFDEIAPSDLKFTTWAERESQIRSGNKPDDLIKCGSFDQAAELLFEEFAPENRN